MLEFRDFCRELLNWNGSMFNTECTVEDDSIEEQIFNDISRLLHERVIKPFLGTRGRHRCPTVNTSSCCVFFSIGSSGKANQTNALRGMRRVHTPNRVSTRLTECGMS